MNYTSVGEAIPPLANLSFEPPDTSRSFILGGQNFTHCCLRAANSSLTIDNGNLSFTNSSYFAAGYTIDSILKSVQDDNFPCGAVFNGDFSGSPVVQVPYTWCTSQCSGWEISHFGSLPQWVGPLVQFIMPSLAFSLNIPRTRKLAIPEFVFQAHPRNIVGFTTYWIRLLGAIIIMMIDTVLWLSICFAFAGPMLLSAVYEFVQDRKILEFLSPQTNPKRKQTIPSKLRAQLLLSVVVGNIRIATGSSKPRLPCVSMQQPRRQDSYGFFKAETSQSSHTAVTATEYNAWHRVMTMLDDLEGLPSPAQLSAGAVSLPTKLKAILMSQASFGSTIGAPILFFVGGFIYTVLDIENSLGDNDQAHAVGFGMWWMTIPYLAIVSCAMLASNSPSALSGIIYDGGSRASQERFEMSFWDQLKERAKSHAFVRALIRRLRGYELVEHTYEGQFRTVPMWNRGPNKRRWVHEAIDEYTNDYRPDIMHNTITPDQLRRGLKMTFVDKASIAVGTVFLLMAPTVLAFLTSYNTPRKALSCRTLTYLVYGISQVCEMALWIWEAHLKVKYGARWSHTKTPAKAINWCGQVFVSLFAIMAAVGGTFMQLMGIYRACACRVPAKYWVDPGNPDAYIILSTNIPEAITAAQDWWTTTGTIAVIMVSVVCSLCWWHQRRLRKVFRDEADSLQDDSRTFQLNLKTPSNIDSESPYTSPTE